MSSSEGVDLSFDTVSSDTSSSPRRHGGQTATLTTEQRRIGVSPSNPWLSGYTAKRIKQLQQQNAAHKAFVTPEWSAAHADEIAQMRATEQAQALLNLASPYDAVKAGALLKRDETKKSSEDAEKSIGRLKREQYYADLAERHRIAKESGVKFKRAIKARVQ